VGIADVDSKCHMEEGIQPSEQESMEDDRQGPAFCIWIRTGLRSSQQFRSLKGAIGMAQHPWGKAPGSGGSDNTPAIHIDKGQPDDP
jgi:hypothetical protein